MAEDTKLPVQDDTKVESAETADELNEGDLDQVAGGAAHTPKAI